MASPTPSRREAIRLLEADRRRVMELIDELPPGARTTRGLGGGTWSPKDLIGHLESWEEHALAALEAWAKDRPAPSDVALRRQGLDALNLSEVRRKARWSAPKAFEAAAATHARLLDTVRALSDQRWKTPPTSRARRPLGDQLGRILGGPAGPFRHDAAHLPDLRVFVQRYGRR